MITADPFAELPVGEVPDEEVVAVVVGAEVVVGAMVVVGAIVVAGAEVVVGADVVAVAVVVGVEEEEEVPQG